MIDPDRRLRALQVAIGVLALLLLALNAAAFGWGWQLVAGAPRESGYLLGQLLRATVRDLAQPEAIQAILEQWKAQNPAALAALVLDDQSRVVAAAPGTLRGQRLPPREAPVGWIARALGVSASGFVAQERPLGSPERPFGRTLAVVPDVAPTLPSGVFVRLILLNPLWLILYWALLPTWVYLDALRRGEPAARRWALLCLPLNLVGFGLYLVMVRRRPRRRPS